jgi:hypothetical protein
MNATYKETAQEAPSKMTNDDNSACCNQCKQPLTEIDNYGERLIGCVECNRWSWRGSDRLFMELPEEDIQALRELVTNGRQARSIR